MADPLRSFHAYAATHLAILAVARSMPRGLTMPFVHVSSYPDRVHFEAKAFLHYGPDPSRHRRHVCTWRALGIKGLYEALRDGEPPVQVELDLEWTRTGLKARSGVGWTPELGPYPV